MKPGFADAAFMRPVALPRGRFVQFFLTAHVREDVQPGTYSGSIGIRKKGKTLASVPVTLRVLPFVLPAPKAYGDPQRDFLVASYTYISIDMIKEENGGDAELARRQLVAILRDHAAHGQTIHWNRGNCNAETLEAIAAMKEAGMRTDVLLGGLSPPHNAQGSPRDGVEIRYRLMRVAREAGDAPLRAATFRLVLLASPTGWDESVRQAVNPSSGYAFSHRQALLYLFDLPMSELTYNINDDRARRYAELFRPVLPFEALQEVIRGVQAEQANRGGRRLGTELSGNCDISGSGSFAGRAERGQVERKSLHW